MSMLQVLKKRVLFLFRLIGALLNKLCCCFKRRKNIGELPYTVVHRSSLQAFQKTGSEQWEGWGNNPFVCSIEEKIEEYRRKKTEPETVPEEIPEPDFFNDMQPKVVQARRAYIADDSNKQAEKSNLFAVKTDEVPSYTGELGTLEDTSENEKDVWDTHIDIERVDSALREQRAKERQQRRLARQMEHARRLGQRKK